VDNSIFENCRLFERKPRADSKIEKEGDLEGNFERIEKSNLFFHNCRLIRFGELLAIPGEIVSRRSGIIMSKGLQ